MLHPRLRILRVRPCRGGRQVATNSLLANLRASLVMRAYCVVARHKMRVKQAMKQVLSQFVLELSLARSPA
jgi:hypothetical protein